eukprot:170439-Hanusia_phi.AAC.2
MATDSVEMLALMEKNSETNDRFEHYSTNAEQGADNDILFIDSSTPRSSQSSKKLSSHRKVFKPKEPGWPYLAKMTDYIRPSTATPSSRLMGRPQSSRSVSSNISNVSSIYSTSSSEVGNPSSSLDWNSRSLLGSPEDCCKPKYRENKRRRISKSYKTVFVVFTLKHRGGIAVLAMCGLRY